MSLTDSHAGMTAGLVDTETYWQRTGPWDLRKFPSHDDDNEDEDAAWNGSLDLEHLEFFDNSVDLERLEVFDNPMDPLMGGLAQANPLALFEVQLYKRKVSVNTALVHYSSPTADHSLHTGRCALGGKSSLFVGKNYEHMHLNFFLVDDGVYTNPPD